MSSVITSYETTGMLEIP